ncbi:hypothetical protein O181_025759 [Austropuccinia psidii MF-1]|uniref:Integrase catalytic domain-containing protein n=1 Tax=Austropuccinia psidii MF-1 TaxID=1389203 RepID=A0A9Q3CIN6_9BASI|nr:hypothetical protein [Austropuccinia psidii MF-1]
MGICDSTNLSPRAPTGFATLKEVAIFETKLNSNETKQGNVTSSDEHNLTNLLHSMFGHIGNKHLKQLVRQRFGIDASNGIARKGTTCQHCCVAKSTRQSNISSRGSTYGECHILTKKSDATLVLLRVLTTWEKKTGKRIKTFRSNNGGEFCNSTLENWCNSRGTVHEKSLPYHHEQNGSIERYNRTIADMGRTLLHESGLAKSFWGFAFMWASRIQNLIPNSLTGEAAPVELLFGEKPCYDQMRLFGKLAYIHVPHKKRRKLDDRAVAGNVVMFLGNSKGWLFYLPSSKSLTTSGWAEFPKSSKACRAICRWSVPWRPRTKDLRDKISISFILNKAILGDFSKEATVEEQDHMAKVLNNTTMEVTTQKTYKQAMGGTDNRHWQAAVNEELANMKQMGVYDIRPLPPGKHVLGGGWVFAKKPAMKMSAVRYKARYVARGNRQMPEEYNRTFAPTASFSSLRILLTMASLREWHVNSFDFVAAYLNAGIDEEVWVCPPDGLTIPTGFGCRLHKALYGTKQAGNCWCHCVANKLQTLGYVASKFDRSVYVHSSQQAMIWLHMDDGIIAGKDIGAIRDVRMALEESFRMKWEDGISSIIGINIHKVRGHHCRQSATSRRLRTPQPPSDHTTSSAPWGSLLCANGDKTRRCICCEPVGQACETTGQGALEVPTALIRSIPTLKVWSDASWGGEFSQSTHGFLAQLGGCSISWCAKQLTTVAASSCHAEFMALGLAARHGKWLKNLLEDITGMTIPLQLLCDNTLAIRIAEDSSSNKRTKHSDREYFITNHLLGSKTANLEWVSSGDKNAEIMTKPLGSVLHQRLCGRVLCIG